jgi:hypothetical protein
MKKLTMAAALCIVTAGPLAAAEKGKPLPAFDLVAADGRTVSSSALSQEQQWLLVYVTPGCLPCDRLVKALGEWRSPLADARTVLVVGAPAGEATKYLAATRPAALAGVPAYTDPSRKIHEALKIGGAPALIGIKDGRVEWTLGGVLNDPRAVESVIRAWVER